MGERAPGSASRISRIVTTETLNQRQRARVKRGRRRSRSAPSLAPISRCSLGCSARAHERAHRLLRQCSPGAHERAHCLVMSVLTAFGSVVVCARGWGIGGRWLRMLPLGSPRTASRMVAVVVGAGALGLFWCPECPEIAPKWPVVWRVRGWGIGASKGETGHKARPWGVVIHRVGTPQAQRPTWRRG
jgi:hypothetical protein